MYTAQDYNSGYGQKRKKPYTSVLPYLRAKEVEHAKSKKTDPLSADPETLKSLGITPDLKSEEESEGKGMTEREKALRYIHPSATDAEIRAML